MQLNRRTFLLYSGCTAGTAWTLAAPARGATAWGDAMEPMPLTPDLAILPGAVNTTLLLHEGKALLFDCCDSVTPERLSALGANQVEMILCTQHRRPNTAGAAAFVESGARLVVPAQERHLFEDAETYWNDPKNRWHLYHNQPGPQVLAQSIPVARAVCEGDLIEWRGFSIQVLDTPGATDGSVSYIVETAAQKICLCGDVLSASGQVWDLHSLQKGFGGLRDYHGFLGNRNKLIPSLGKLAACGADILVPSHGTPLTNPAEAAAKTEERLDALWRNYTTISALNFYFPAFREDTKDNPQRMEFAATSEAPDWVRRVAYTSFAVVAEDGATLLIDCGHDSVLDTLREWQAEKKIGSVDACWVTHYHDDHVDALPRLADEFKCPVMTDRRLSENIEHPERFFLPCIAPHGAPVAKATEHGESWTWHEFTLTAFHFPGQTFYHAGLLVEGRGTSVFFAGDSGAPSGLDDYCAGNRVFLGAGKGSRQCLDIWRKTQPEHIINQHQERSFRFSAEQLDYMEATLEKREALIAAMTPWPHANFATDEWWIRTYPYEQKAAPGARIAIDVEFTNHAPTAAQAQAEPVLPKGWQWEDQTRATAKVPPATAGSRDAAFPNPDAAIRLHCTIPQDTPPGRYTIPIRITWDGRYLGQFRHAIVIVR